MRHCLLNVQTAPRQRAVHLDLMDDQGVSLASQRMVLDGDHAADWESLLDLRNAALREGESSADMLRRVGTFLGRQVLGGAIMGVLAHGVQELRVRLDDPRQDPLSAVFLHLPWELARSAPDAPTLGDVGVAVRIEPRGIAAQPAATEDVGELRLLLVFAPEVLGWGAPEQRQQRDLLLRGLRDLLLSHQVRIDVAGPELSGQRLASLLEDSGGYHAVYWCAAGGDPLIWPRSEGDEGDGARDLLGLLGALQMAPPALVLLHPGVGGSRRELTDWRDLARAVVDPRSPLSGGLNGFLTLASATAGAAWDLLAGGVRQVVLLRGAPAPSFSAELVAGLLRRMVVDAEPTPRALQAALGALAGEAGAPVADVASALLVGGGDLSWRVAEGGRAPTRPPLLARHLPDLDPVDGLLGRMDLLSRLAARWLPPASRVGVVALTGAPGVGKTALAAEAIHMWRGGFQHVFADSFVMGPLSVDDWLRGMDHRLLLDSQRYRQRCRAHPGQRIYLPTGGGRERAERMLDNLLLALEDEAILLVWDALSVDAPAAPDPDAVGLSWSLLLARLVSRLAASGSRVLLTSRALPEGWAEQGLARLPVPPLSLTEMLPYLRARPQTAALFGGSAGGRALLRGLVEASRGHPLALRWLTSLAGDPRDLGAVLVQIAPAQAADGAASGVDILADIILGRVGVAARRMLWFIALAREGLVAERVVAAWAQDTEEEQVERWWGGLSSLWDTMMQGVEDAERVELGAGFVSGAAIPQDPAQRRRVAPELLAELLEAGLVEHRGRGDSRRLFVPGVVVSAIRRWMEQHPSEAAAVDEATVHRVWGGFHMDRLEPLRASDPAAAIAVGRLALEHRVRAGDLEQIGLVVFTLLTSSSDLEVIGPLVLHLQRLADAVPAGPDRWRLQAEIALSLYRAGWPGESLGLYEQASSAARADESWGPLGSILHNQANALRDLGQLQQARALYLEAASAKMQAGRPELDMWASDLEARFLDVRLGRAQDAVPRIEQGLTRIRKWYEQGQRDEPTPEAPDPQQLGKALDTVLLMAGQVYLALQDWPKALGALQDLEAFQKAVGQDERTRLSTRFSQHLPLARMGRFLEAERLLEECLRGFDRLGEKPQQAKALSALALVRAMRRDLSEAARLERQALALHEQGEDILARAGSHHMLSTFLDHQGALQEAGAHQLASLVYQLSTSQERLDANVGFIAHCIRRGVAEGRPWRLPRLQDLLDDPGFQPLVGFLEERGAGAPEAQAAVDDLMARIRGRVRSLDEV